MRQIQSRLLVFLLALIVGCASVPKAVPLTQIQAFSFDFDDNIFVTPARILLWDPKEKKEVGVSTAEWALVQTQLGKSGKWKHLVLRPDGLRYFGDTGPNGVLEFKQQIERALEAAPITWKAGSWDAFVQALSDPRTRHQTTIITARLHSPESILAGLQVLKDRGLIPSLPEKENIYAVRWPGFPKKFTGASSAESKSRVMKFLLDTIEKEKVPVDATPVHNREGTGLEKLHLWGFSDDDYENYSKALTVLRREVARGHWPHVRLALFFTGLNHPDHKPHSVIIKPDGTTRPY